MGIANVILNSSPALPLFRKEVDPINPDHLIIKWLRIVNASPSNDLIVSSFNVYNTLLVSQGRVLTTSTLLKNILCLTMLLKRPEPLLSCTDQLRYDTLKYQSTLGTKKNVVVLDDMGHKVKECGFLQVEAPGLR